MSLLLILYVAPFKAWIWNSPVVTKAPDVDEDISGDKEENIAGVGAEIIDVASGIQELVQNWDQKPNVNEAVSVIAEKPGHIKTGNAKSLSEGVEHEIDGDASGSGSGHTLDLAQEGRGTNLTGMWVTESSLSIFSTTSFPKDSSNCLPRGSDWPFCKSRGAGTFSVPNFFNHTGAEDVAAVMNEWGWLLRSGCHHGLEWFFCLLLAPRCHLPSERFGVALLPCRTFCEVLLDSCWTVLQERGLPLACHTLPEGPDPSQPCFTVSNYKGKTVMHFKLVPLFSSLCLVRCCAFYRERHRSLHLSRSLCSAAALSGLRPPPESLPINRCCNICIHDT